MINILRTLMEKGGNMQEQRSSTDGDKKNENAVLAHNNVITEVAETLNGLVRSDRMKQDPVKKISKLKYMVIHLQK